MHTGTYNFLWVYVIRGVCISCLWYMYSKKNIHRRMHTFLATCFIIIVLKYYVWAGTSQYLWWFFSKIVYVDHLCLNISKLYISTRLWLNYTYVHDLNMYFIWAQYSHIFKITRIIIMHIYYVTYDFWVRLKLLHSYL